MPQHKYPASNVAMHHPPSSKLQYQYPVVQQDPRDMMPDRNRDTEPFNYGVHRDADGRVYFRHLPGPGGAGGAAAAGLSQHTPKGPRIPSQQPLSVMVTTRQAKEAEKEQIAVENRIKYLDGQNARVLRDLRAVHRSAEKLDCGRRRTMERRQHEMLIRAEQQRERHEKAEKIRKHRAVDQHQRKLLEHDKLKRLIQFQRERDNLKNEAKNKLFGAEDKMKTLEAEERLCVERLTYSKMVSQRVLEQLENTLVSAPRATASRDTADMGAGAFFLDDPAFNPPSRANPEKKAANPPAAQQTPPVTPKAEDAAPAPGEEPTKERKLSQRKMKSRAGHGGMKDDDLDPAFG